MAISYSVDPVHQRLITYAEGLVTFEDVNQHLDMEERNRDLSRPELIDARKASTDLTTEQVRQLSFRAAHMLRKTELGPTAIVTTDDVLYGMARMYSVFAETVGASAKVFRDIESATRWLESFGSSLHLVRE